jgi:PAS domain S-box-containing protein
MPLNAAALPHTYDVRLVALSVLIAILAAHAALDLAGRTAAARGNLRFAWLACGAFAMGFGIWSMHYIGMLALKLGVPILYDFPTVALSLLAAMFGAATALWIVSRKELSVISVAFGSLVMGAAICAMHYVGMAAMRLPAMCHYNSIIVRVSILIAVIVSAAAMLLTFRFRTVQNELHVGKILSAVVMGFAVAAMHYTGMASVSFTASPLVEGVSHAVDVSSLGVAGITIVSVFVVGIVAITSLLDRRFSAQATQLASSEERYRLLFQRSLAAVYRSTPDGRILDCNETCARILGYESPRELMTLDANSASFEEGDRSEYLARLSSDGLVSNLETSFKRKDGKRVWVLENANLVDDPTGGGSVVEGTFLDISDRKGMELELTQTKELAERHHRDDRTRPRYRSQFRAARIPEHGEAVRGFLADSDQRYSRLLQNRSRQAGRRRNRLQSPRQSRRHHEIARLTRASEGAGTGLGRPAGRAGRIDWRSRPPPANHRQSRGQLHQVHSRR